MKVTIKQLSILIILTMTLVSCSKSNKKGNKIKTNPNNNGTYNNQSHHNTPQSIQTAPISAHDMNRIKGSFQCTQGTRLSGDITYHINASQVPSPTTLAGQFQPGAFPSGGNTVKLFVGVSRFNDLMIVSKISNGNQVLGYNVTISYCGESGPNGIPYIGDQRPISNFRADNGIILYEHVNCGYGSVDSAQFTYAESAPYQYLQTYPIWTTFYTACLN